MFEWTLGRSASGRSAPQTPCADSGACPSRTSGLTSRGLAILKGQDPFKNQVKTVGLFSGNTYTRTDVQTRTRTHANTCATRNMHSTGGTRMYTHAHNIHTHTHTHVHVCAHGCSCGGSQSLDPGRQEAWLGKAPPHSAPWRVRAPSRSRWTRVLILLRWMEEGLLPPFLQGRGGSHRRQHAQRLWTQGPGSGAACFLRLRGPRSLWVCEKPLRSPPGFAVT